MSSKDNITVAGIKLPTDKPTHVDKHRLIGWVIWQFTQPEKKGFHGAVRPPETDHEWIPAVIQADENRVRVFGNSGQVFPTPEKAVAYFNEGENNPG